MGLRPVLSTPVTYKTRSSKAYGTTVLGGSTGSASFFINVRIICHFITTINSTINTLDAAFHLATNIQHPKMPKAIENVQANEVVSDEDECEYESPLMEAIYDGSLPGAIS